MVFTERDIREMVTASLKRLINENRQDELVGWHGSVADFNEFDTNFIGTGESTQVYGWGIYITGVKETGRFYAALIARNKNSADKSNAAIAMNQRIEKSIKGPFKKLRAGKITFDECKNMVLDNMVKNGVSEFFIEKYKEVRNWADSRKFGAMALDMASRAYKRFVYTVDIPDDGMLDWNGVDKQTLFGIYQKFVEKFGKLNVNINKVNTLGELYCQLAGGSRCKKLWGLKKENMQLAPETISKFLMSLGYKGITVPIGNSHGGDGTGLNYVLFSGNFIKIIKKELI